MQVSDWVINVLLLSVREMTDSLQAVHLLNTAAALSSMNHFSLNVLVSGGPGHSIIICFSYSEPTWWCSWGKPQHSTQHCVIHREALRDSVRPGATDIYRSPLCRFGCADLSVPLKDQPLQGVRNSREKEVYQRNKITAAAYFGKCRLDTLHPQLMGYPYMFSGSGCTRWQKLIHLSQQLTG